MKSVVESFPKEKISLKKMILVYDKSKLDFTADVHFRLICSSSILVSKFSFLLYMGSNLV